MPAVAPGSLLILLCLLFTLLSRGSAERTLLNKIFTDRNRHKHGDGSYSSDPGPAHRSAEGDDIANALSVGSGAQDSTPDALSNPPGTRDSGLGVETLTGASTVKSELAEAMKEAKEQGMHISDGPLSTLQQDTARADLAKQGRASGLDEKMEILAAQSEAGMAGQESDLATERTLPLSEELERSSAAAGLMGGAGGGAGASKNAAGGKGKKKKSSDNKSIFGPSVTGIDDEESEEADLYAVSDDSSDLDTKDSRTKHNSANKYEHPLTSDSKADTKADRKAKSQAGGMHEMSQTSTSAGTKRKPAGSLHEMSQTTTSRSKATASDLPASQRERSREQMMESALPQGGSMASSLS